METREFYFKSKFETREENEDKIIDGYFIVYEQETELWQGYYEKIGAYACRNSINTNDIRALFNHNSDIVLGRKSANTLILSEDETGVRGIIRINKDDTEACNIYERVKRGDINGCSFGFCPILEEYDKRANGEILLVVKEAEVIEISVCSFPAYPQTYIKARQQNFNKQKQVEFEQKKQSLKEMLNHGFRNFKTKKTIGN